MISKLLAGNLQPPLQPPLPPCWVCHSPTVPHNITPSTRHRTLDTVKRCSGEQKSWRECWRDTVSSDYPGHRSLWSVSAIVCTLRMCAFCLVMHTVPSGYLYKSAKTVPGYLYESAETVPRYLYKSAYKVPGYLYESAKTVPGYLYKYPGQHQHGPFTQYRPGTILYRPGQQLLALVIVRIQVSIHWTVSAMV